MPPRYLPGWGIASQVPPRVGYSLPEVYNGENSLPEVYNGENSLPGWVKAGYASLGGLRRDMPPWGV